MRLGCLLPPPEWEGEVRGVFSRAIAVLHPEGYLVSILDEGAPMEAFALQLDRASFARLRAAGMAFLESRLLRMLPGRLELAGCSLSLEGAETWDPRPRLESARLSLAQRPPANLATARIELSALLAAEGSREGIHGTGAFARGFARLAKAADFPRNLLGFGPGTTPAGDDWFSGWALAHAVTMQPVFGPGALELSRTSPAGRSLLLQVLDGAFPETHLAVAEALAEGGAGLEAAARALLSHGASSGSDTLAGFIAGLGSGA